MWLLANDLIYENTPALQRRVIIFNFASRFVNGVTDDHVNHIYAIKNYNYDSWIEPIISYLVQIAKMDESIIPTSILEYTKSKHEEQNCNIQDFCNEAIINDKYAIATYRSVKELFFIFNYWRSINNIKHVPIQKKFGMKLREIYIGSYTKNGFKNLEIKTEFIPPLDFKIIPSQL